MQRKEGRPGGTKERSALAKWLKSVRALQGLEQSEFAKYIGKSRSAIAMYENGTNIPQDVIAAIVSAFPDAPRPPLGDEISALGAVISEDVAPTILYAGVVPCSSQWGDPLTSEERRPIDYKFAGRLRFLCKVSGDSCYPALRQGDLTVWEVDSDPPEGVIVLAERTGDQACTVKQLHYDASRRRHVLIPVNPDYDAPEDGDGWKTTARLVGVIRNGDGPERTWYWPAGIRPHHLTA